MLVIVLGRLGFRISGLGFGIEGSGPQCCSVAMDSDRKDIVLVLLA